MNIAGVIKFVGDIQSIQTKEDKIFQKREVVIETEERYPQSLMFEVTGEDVKHVSLVTGNKVLVELNVRATLYNNRWYNNIRAWKIANHEE